jgi:hypothetical protein
MSTNPVLAQVWDVDAPHAKSLFWFLDCWIRCLRPRLGPEIRVRIVVDQQDWFSDRRVPVFSPGLARIGVTDIIQVEVLGITDKAEMAVAPYLPFLGLVDSELWAFGRLLSLRMPDGETVHDRYMRRVSSGPISDDDIVISESTWNDLFRDHHGAHEQLKQYWVTLSNWGPTRNVDVNEALSAVEWEYTS